MKATRERKEKFIRDFGARAPMDAINTLYARYGLGILADDMLDEIVSDMARDWRHAQRCNRENREREFTRELLAERAREKSEDAERNRREEDRRDER